MSEYDYVVVGGGTAGSVLAARLADLPGVTVLLLEAGPDGGPGALSDPGRWTELWGSDVDWAFTSEPQPGLGGRTVPVPRGRLLGGSGAINALTHLRGHPAAIDAWAADAPGWDFAALLPFYRRSEDVSGLVVDGARPDPGPRGFDGPVRLSWADRGHPLARAAFDAFRERGFPASDDLNGASPEGVGWTQLTVVDGVRRSAADAYLRGGDRPGLTVLARARVTGLEFRGTRCVGVRWTRDGMRTSAGARREVVLCAGAIGSPQLLMLSGVGPADTLRGHGIEPVADLPGVGANLSEHPLGLVRYLAARDVPPAWGNHCPVTGFARVDPASPVPDVQLFLLDRPSAPGTRGYAVAFSVVAPRSRGRVALRSPDPFAAPAVDPGLLTEPGDMDTFLGALRLAREVGEARAFAPWRGEEAEPGAGVRGDGAERAYLRRSARTYFHPVGTCRMGSGADAVTDVALRVRGVEGLRVADASVLPSPPAGNVNATVLAVAERAAALIAGADGGTAGAVGVRAAGVS